MPTRTNPAIVRALGMSCAALLSIGLVAAGVMGMGGGQGPLAAARSTVSASSHGLGRPGRSAAARTATPSTPSTSAADPGTVGPTTTSGPDPAASATSTTTTSTTPGRAHRGPAGSGTPERPPGHPDGGTPPPGESGGSGTPAASELLALPGLLTVATGTGGDAALAVSLLPDASGTPAVEVELCDGDIGLTVLGLHLGCSEPTVVAGSDAPGSGPVVVAAGSDAAPGAGTAMAPAVLLADAPAGQPQLLTILRS